MYTKQELINLGFAYVGENVKIFKNNILINPKNIYLGDGCQIDDYVHIIASKPIKIGKRVHIGTQTTITGGGEFIIEDYAGIAAGCRIITGTDDFLGLGMTNPCVPEKFRIVHRNFVHIKKHALLGTNTIVLPGVTIEEGTACSVLSVFTKDSKPWTIYRGNPAKAICQRESEKILSLEKELIKEYKY